MSTSDGSVIGVTKIVDHGPESVRWNIVILGDGYKQSELATYHTDAQNFATYLQKTAPFDKLWPGINIHRVDVSSTDSGAADPTACGGTGATPKTYFDATFCGDGQIRRLLQVNAATALSVSSTQVPAVEMTFVIVNSTIYGGSGGQVAVFSKDPSATEIAVHEMGHTAFALADEYEYYAGCSSGETGHDTYAGSEPAEPNVTANKDKSTIKWASLIGTATAVPTTSNADCTKCDTQANPYSATTVGGYEGARYFHCGLFRPQYNCRMRVLGNPFCAACSREIVKTISPYLPLPVVTGVTPNSGVAGISVVIAGTGFTGATSVGFGATGSPSITVNSDTQITALSPDGGIGTVDVTVVTPSGTSVSSAADQFTYGTAAAAPVITGINPTSGPAGTTVTITGTGFAGATSVGFGPTSAPSITVNSDTQITAVSPGGGPGTVDVTVVTPSGSSGATAADQFTYAAATGLPSVTAVSPKTGSGGATVTITGSGFTGVTSVGFGNVGSPNVTVSSDTQIIAISPAGGRGTVDITVVTPAGTSPITVADQFTYGSAATLPVITGISPGSGAAGTIVTISGTGFTGATSVGFGATGSANITVNSDTQIIAVTPAGGSGTVDISVVTPAGMSSASAMDRFAYIASGVSTTGLTPTGTPTGLTSGPVVSTGPATVGSVSPAGYYVDPGLTSQLVGSIVNILQSASSPDALEAQNIILRRIALQGDVIGSRIPPPRNISEIGGYINLLGALKQPDVRAQALAGILGVAGPTDPLGWISNNQPLAFVTLPNDRPPGVAQPTISLTFTVRSDFNSALQNALTVLHQQGCSLPIAGRPAITLPQATPGVLPPDDVLPYLGRTLDLVPGAALLNPQVDPLVLIRARGSSNPFQIAANVVAPGGVAVTPGNYDALQCNLTTCSVVPINNALCVSVGPVLASAGFYPGTPLPTPTSISSTRWAHFTNLTGLVSGVTKLGDELSLLYNWSTINHSVFASALHRVWNGSQFA